MSRSGARAAAPAPLVALVCLGAALLAAALPAAARNARTGLEPAVKAELVERFVRFIDWPQESTWKANRPFVVCAFGDSEVTDPLRDLLTERSFLRGHPAELVEIGEPQETRSCDVVLVSPGSHRELEAILAETRNRPILTIGDAEGFARDGAILNFYREQGYVRFELNQQAARRSGLSISAKLLRLARPVSEE